MFDTPYQAAPFSKFEAKDYKPAIEKAIAQALDTIKSIVTNIEVASFQNTIEALAYATENLDRLTSMFYNLYNAETNEIFQEQAQEIAPLLSDFQNDIYLNQALFERIKLVYNQYVPATAEEKMLLKTTYKQFVRNGANLSEENKQILREIDKNLSVKTLHFAQNVLEATNTYELFLTNENDLDGLPNFAKEAAKELAQKRQKNGFVFTLDAPSFIPFMTYIKNRNLRKELFLANAGKCYESTYDNRQNILDIVQLRQQRATLLGYKSHADFVLEERMAQSPEIVAGFLNELLQKALPSAQKQFDQLQTFALNKDGITDFQKWDTAFYSEQLKQSLFSLSDEVLKPYFQLESVLSGIFSIAQKLYGLHFEEITNIETYHPDVKTFKVTDDKNNYVSILYTDFYPRKGKRNGAWMTSFKGQYITPKGENSRPHISIVCNFTPPTTSLPSLLTFNEVRTLFHEFGHALHGILANTKYPNLSGTNVFWDFVELPSQLMENWCYQKEALLLFAYHYQTQEAIPMEYVEKIKASAAFMEGLQTLRQLSFGLLDMAWHTNPNIDSIEQIKNFEKKAIKPTELYPDIEKNNVSTSFSHIFSGGYSSGYYSYKWAEVLDADAFEVFEEKGIFDTKTAQSFKENILSKGGSEPPMDLYVRFRGKKPSVEALLKRSKLIK
ncbi:M3 family metallopeptidase [Capnocytophaga catalasegens]|uniref:Peptidase M3 n=1 Tax=Capnocytophaga catalasegens TaxID=1004260 RepID=A0AAV5AUY0_9FLAO|nr:M3 family metallopeptidase [Capnocytophaga catalasegens]GIZ14811.1 peptidase M3 [Capnocytophaga catalasegens]GJM51179.1 peptidase M3 [Capnocytophaga catalasegens]GJM53510.1 peptidase M3 [Capnocytophaga catalasegens]